MSYIKMLGFGFGGPLGLKKLAGGSSNSLFSTAVISGSSSAPNLRDMISNTASATAIEGFGGVPPIRPLETLHNALSLRQLDTFLDKMTSAQLFRTPASSPPKYPSTPLPTPTSMSQMSSSISNATHANHPPPLKLQSPSNSLGWSGPPSFVSSSGASSPTELSGLCSRESSDMSASLISSDGLNVGAISQMFPIVPGLDQDLGSVGILLEHESQTPGDDSVEIAEFYSPTTGRLHVQGDSGDITPVSGCSELDCNTADATAGSTADADVTMTEDFDASEEDVLGDRTTPLQECISHTQHSSLLGVGEIKTNSKEHFVLDRLSNLSIIDPLQNVSHDYINKLSNNLNIISKHETHLKHVENAERIQNQPSTSSKSQYDIEGNINKSYTHFYSCPQSPSVSSDGNKNSSANVRIYEKDYAESSKNISSLGLDKWNTSKEKFCDINRLDTKLSNNSNQFKLMNEVFDKKLIDVAKNLNVDESKPKVEKSLSNELQLHQKATATSGAVVVKESFIEPPRMTRISKSYHGKTTTSTTLNIDTTPRRASDSVTNETHGLKNTFPICKTKSHNENDKNKSVNVQRQLMTQLSQPCGSTTTLSTPVRKSSLSEKCSGGSRFKTTIVDEAEHAASILQHPARTNSNLDSSSLIEISSKTHNLDNSNLKK